MVLSLAFILSIVASAVAVVLIFPIVGAVQAQIDCPAIIGEATQGIMYISDSAGGEQFRGYDLSGNTLYQFDIQGVLGTNENKGVGSDSEGNIYVTDITTELTIKLDPTLSQILQTFTVPSGDPFDVAVDSQDFVYVADRANDQIVKFAQNGTIVLSWGSLGNATGQFDDPVSLYFDSNDILYVLDGGQIVSSRVTKYDTDGNFISSWNITGAPSVPIYITIDDNDFVYIADGLGLGYGSGDNFISKFDTDGNLLLQFDGDGDDGILTTLNLPTVHGISVIGDRLFVGLGDTNNNTFGYFLTTDGTQLQFQTGDLGAMTSLEDIEIIGGTSPTSTPNQSCESGKALVTSAIGIIPVGLFFGLFTMFNMIGLGKSV